MPTQQDVTVQRPLSTILCLIPFAVVAILDTSAQSAKADEPLVFISSFAAGDEGAIHALQLESQSGALEPIHRTTGVEHAFFLALSRDHRFLYSIHAKQFGGQEDEHVAAYELDGRSGRLTLLNRQSARGTAACYLDVDATGKTVLVANYSSGSVASLPVQENGKLRPAASIVQHTGSSVNPARQKEPHAHCFMISPDNRFAFAADLGLDQVLCYRLDAATATLSPNRQQFVRTPAGSGPRHLTFHPNGKHVYVINELSNSVMHFDYEPNSGVLFEKQTIPTLPEDFKGTSNCADVKITPNGRFLYGTNRGHDSIAAYQIGDDGGLTLIAIEPSRGKGPQNLAIVPGGELLLCANLPGNNVAVFRIDEQAGKLTSVGPPIAINSPSCIMTVP
jgi:6-phosphogluconolactonase